MSWRLRQRGYEQARRWRVRKSGWYVPLLALTYLGALVLLFLAGTAVFTLAGRNGQKDPFWSPMTWVDGQCEDSQFSCGVLQSISMPLLTIALATVAYLFFRFNRVRRAYQKKAREAPHELVETAGGVFGARLWFERVSWVAGSAWLVCARRPAEGLALLAETAATMHRS